MNFENLKVTRMWNDWSEIQKNISDILDKEFPNLKHKEGIFSKEYIKRNDNLHSNISEYGIFYNEMLRQVRLIKQAFESELVYQNTLLIVGKDAEVISGWMWCYKGYIIKKITNRIVTLIKDSYESKFFTKSHKPTPKFYADTTQFFNIRFENEISKSNCEFDIYE